MTFQYLTNHETIVLLSYNLVAQILFNQGLLDFQNKDDNTILIVHKFLSSHVIFIKTVYDDTKI